ncbi:MAG: hypothetical protein WC341_00625 [Bacteroidales bacterium]
MEALIKMVNSNSEAIQAMLDRIIDENKLFRNSENDGLNLELMGLSLGEPAHKIYAGDVYSLGTRHFLACASPINEIPIWYGFLSPDMWFCPYPNPLTLLGEYDKGILAVSPSVYMCGHILDRWVESHGEASIEKR